MAPPAAKRAKAVVEWGRGSCHLVQGHTRPVNSLQWSAQGSYLASGSDDKSARVWSTADNGSGTKCVAKLEQHGDSVVNLCWDPSSEAALATLAADKTVRVWDIRAKSGAQGAEGCGGRLVASIKANHEYINMAWSPDGRVLACGSSVGAKDDTVKDCISLIDTRKHSTIEDTANKVVKRLKFSYEVNEFCWAPDSKHLLLTTEHGTVEALEAVDDSGAPPPTPSHADKAARKSTLAVTLHAHTDDCYCVAIDKESGTLAIGSKDSLVSLWDLSELACVRTLDRHLTPVRCVALSHGARYVASSAYDPGVEIASAATGELVHSIDAQHAMNSLAWHPTKLLLAYAIDAKQSSTERARREEAAPPYLRLYAPAL